MVCTFYFQRKKKSNERRELHPIVDKNLGAAEELNEDEDMGRGCDNKND